MDYGKSFTFPFKDQDWLMKLIVGGVFVLLSGILVGIPFVLGYAIEVIRNVIAGNDEVLPAWDNLGEKFMQGLILALILLVLALPAILVQACSSVGLGALASNGSEGVSTLAGLLMLLVYLVVALYSLIIGVASPAIYLRYTMTRQFGASLQPAAIWAVIRANIGQYILVLIVGYGAMIVASFGSILCVIGVFVTVFWAYLVQAHLLGQYYRNFVTPGSASMAGPAAPAAF